MLSRKRPAVVLGVLMLALSAFVYTSSQASPQKKSQAAPAPTPNQPPTITLDADTQVVTLCPDAESTANPRVHLKAAGISPEGKPLRYKWTVSGGRLDGDGTDVVWDLSDAQPGVYNAAVTVESGPVDNPLCTAFTSTKVVVRNCPPPRPVCPNVSIYCPDVQQAGTPVTFTASVSGGTVGVTPIYHWNVSAGQIISGQGTATITVDTAGLAGQPITATVEVAGYNLDCRATCQAAVPAPPNPTKFDEIGEIQRDDEKARLDVFAIELQNSPGAQGYIIAYGGRNKRFGTGQQRAERARNYVVTTRGIDASRIVTLDGGTHETGSTELWLVPAGATPPRPR
ncbi:MAG: hypothetical protein QOC99_2288 [Acidobacteriota bacterium]|jgi:hypothetical protein|nr:hypothetical protein [Acidobacteriota bacterium]MDT7779776.1 hypothetical protein [Acidobacteriota bacterium]